MFSTKDAAQRFENRAKSIDKIMNLFATPCNLTFHHRSPLTSKLYSTRKLTTSLCVHVWRPEVNPNVTP